jgi:hypothetical protein
MASRAHAAAGQGDARLGRRVPRRSPAAAEVAHGRADRACGERRWPDEPRHPGGRFESLETNWKCEPIRQPCRGNSPSTDYGAYRHHERNNDEARTIAPAHSAARPHPLRRTTQLRRARSLDATGPQRAAVAGRACIACGSDRQIDPPLSRIARDPALARRLRRPHLRSAPVPFMPQGLRHRLAGPAAPPRALVADPARARRRARRADRCAANFRLAPTAPRRAARTLAPVSTARRTVAHFQ